MDEALKEAIAVALNNAVAYLDAGELNNAAKAVEWAMLTLQDQLMQEALADDTLS
jgi:hypothetical protein